MMLLQEFSASIYLRREWYDPRLRYDHLSNVSEIQLHFNMFESFWTPNLMFVNERRSTFHTLTLPNRSLRIYPDGRIFLSQRCLFRECVQSGYNSFFLCFTSVFFIWGKCVPWNHYLSIGKPNHYSESDWQVRFLILCYQLDKGLHIFIQDGLRLARPGLICNTMSAKHYMILRVLYILINCTQIITHTNLLF